MSADDAKRIIELLELIRLGTAFIVGMVAIILGHLLMKFFIERRDRAMLVAEQAQQQMLRERGIR